MMEGHKHRLNVLRDDLQSVKDKRISELEASRSDLCRCKHGTLIRWEQCPECSDEEDKQDMKDKRIAELEAENASLKTELSKCTWHSAINEASEDAAVFANRVKKLEAELDKAKEQIKCVEIQRDGAVKRGIMVLESKTLIIDELKADNARLRELLKRIEEHEHCKNHPAKPDLYHDGILVGHQCAAEIAREARET